MCDTHNLRGRRVPRERDDCARSVPERARREADADESNREGTLAAARETFSRRISRGR